MNSISKTNNAKAGLLSKMSHELKTPMNAILCLSDLAMESNNIDEIKDYLRKLHYSGEKMVCSIDNTLEAIDKGNVEYKEVHNVKKEAQRKQKDDIKELQGREILLCEDHPMNIFVEEKLLKKVGCNVTVARNGLEGVEAFDESTEGFFDAILMDIRMPIMDGLQACQVIRCMRRKDSKKIPIIAVTANSYDIDEEKALELGMSGYLEKPIVPNLMYMTLANKIND